jgi:hypothetical protein
VNRKINQLALINAVALTLGTMIPRAAKLKASVDEDTFKKMPEAMQAFYDKDEDSGKYFLATDDKDFKKQLDEYRGNNVSLKRKQEELVAQLKKFEGVDPEKWAEAKEALEWLDSEEDAKLLKAGKLDEVVNRKTAKMREETQKTIDGLKKELEKVNKEKSDFTSLYDGLLIDTDMGNIVRGVGNVVDGAMTDILKRARDNFERDPENPKKLRPKEGVLDKDGKPYTPETWAKQLVADAPYFFGKSGGGGAKGNAAAGGGTVGKVLRNPTPMEMGQHAEAIAKGEITVING